MTLRYIEGFETERHPTFLQRKYTGASTLIGTISQSDGRSGVTGKAIGSHDTILESRSFATQDNWILGFGLYIASGGGWENTITKFPNVAFYKNGVEQLRLEFFPIITPSGRGLVALRVQNANGTHFTSTAVVRPNSWYYIEFKATLTSTGTFEIKGWFPDGTDSIIGSGSGDFDPEGTGGANGFRLDYTRNSSSNPFFFDDVYFLDDQGPRNTDYLGPIYTRGFFPNADGTTTAWTRSDTGFSHWELLESGPDFWNTTEDDKNVFTNVAALIEGVNLDDTVGAPTNIDYLGVQTNYSVSMDTSGSFNVTMGVRINNNQFGDTVLVDWTNYQYINQLWEVNPQNNNPFRPSDIDALQQLLRSS